MSIGVFFLVVGPSGVGKDTLLEGARQALDGSQRFVFARRSITRAADAGGEEHTAVSEAEFLAQQAQGNFLLSWQAHGLHYGLPAALLGDIRDGRHVLANGSRATVTELASRVPRLVVLSITANRDQQAQRIAQRGRESAEEVLLRLARAPKLELPPGVECIEIDNSGKIEDGVQAFLGALDSVARRLRIVPYPIDSGREPVAYLPSDSLIGAHDYLGNDRVDLIAVGLEQEKSIRAVIHVADTGPALAADQIGLSKYSFELLGLPAGTTVRVARTPTPKSRAALRAKVNGQELSEEQYLQLLTDMVEGRYPDSEIAAFLVSAAHHLSDAEVLALARVRSRFMTAMHWSAPMVVDKHSMGGIPGSRITLIVIPIVAAHGMAIPKTSSRAITSPAGTADTMEVLARVDLSADEVRQTVERVGACIAWNGRLNHSAIDDVMNRITRPLGIDSARWSVASILSKKLTAGSTHVIVDIPCGAEAKLRDQGQAQELARLFTVVGAGLGLKVEAHVSDGNAPIGSGIGPALEARDVMRVLDNAADASVDLRDKALFFASRILAWDPAIGTAEKGLERARQLLASGAARDRLLAIIEAQGKQPHLTLPGLLRHTIRARSAGRVTAIRVSQISEIARSAGAPMDKAAGIDLLVRRGDLVHAEQALFVVHSSTASDLARAVAAADFADAVLVQP